MLHPVVTALPVGLQINLLLLATYPPLSLVTTSYFLPKN